MNVCCKCGEAVESWFHGQGFICEICKLWKIEREDVFPTISQVFDEQFHRIGKGGQKYWGKRGAGIVFTDGSKILLLKRSEPSDHAGTWAIPGGKAKKGESPIDTAWRETREETGQSHTGQQVTQFVEKDGSHRFVVYLYRISHTFDVKLSKEHSHWEWVSIPEVKNYKLHPKFEAGWPYYCKAIDKKPASFNEWIEQKND